MKKSDLKTGMWVTLRNGFKYLVLRQCDTAREGYQELLFANVDGFHIGTVYGEDMTCMDDENWDIVKVQYEGFITSYTLNPDSESHKVIWERKETCNHGNSEKGFCYCPHCGEKL